MAESSSFVSVFLDAIFAVLFLLYFFNPLGAVGCDGMGEWTEVFSRQSVLGWVQTDP